MSGFADKKIPRFLCSPHLCVRKAQKSVSSRTHDSARLHIKFCKAENSLVADCLDGSRNRNFRTNKTFESWVGLNCVWKELREIGSATQFVLPNCSSESTIFSSTHLSRLQLQAPNSPTPLSPRHLPKKAKPAMNPSFDDRPAKVVKFSSLSDGWRGRRHDHFCVLSFVKILIWFRTRIF